MNGNGIRILIADDHPIFHEGLARVIARDARLQVVAEAEDGERAIADLIKFQPDVAVLDLDMPGRDGFEVTRAAQAAKLAVKVIILTSHKNEELFHSALDLGVAGYVLKDGAIVEIVNAIRAVAAAGRKTSFTNTGESVDFYANGFEIESVVPGGDRIKMSGTSMAAPQVANLAAKLLALNPRLTPTQLIRLIARGAEPSAEDPKIRSSTRARAWRSCGGRRTTR
jgi:DNA-binding NarL/FixJ family response regulator